MAFVSGLSFFGLAVSNYTAAQETTVKTIFVVFAMMLFTSIATFRDEPKVLAASLQQAGEAKGLMEGKGCSAPKLWGPLKGVADRSVAFEDSAGNIRILDLGPCMRGETRLIVEINRP